MQKLELKILNFGRMADISWWQHFSNFFPKIRFFGQYWKFFKLFFLFWLVGHSSQCIHQISRSNNNLEPLNWIPALYPEGSISDHSKKKISIISWKLTELSQFLFGEENFPKNFEKWNFELKIGIARSILYILRSGFL